MVNAVIIIGWEPKSTRFRPLSISLPPPLFPSSSYHFSIFYSWWIPCHIPSCESLIKPARDKKCVLNGILR